MPSSYEIRKNKHRVFLAIEAVLCYIIGNE